MANRFQLRDRCTQWFVQLPACRNACTCTKLGCCPPAPKNHGRIRPAPKAPARFQPGRHGIVKVIPHLPHTRAKFGDPDATLEEPTLETYVIQFDDDGEGRVEEEHLEPEV